jgi:hypothetical protein
MRFYNCQHRHYCGIDLHVKTMYVCILDATGQVLIHRTIKSTPEAFLGLVAPYRDDLVVAAECMFPWYWLADVCAGEGIDFVLGHALASSPKQRCSTFAMPQAGKNSSGTSKRSTGRERRCRFSPTRSDGRCFACCRAGRCSRWTNSARRNGTGSGRATRLTRATQDRARGDRTARVRHRASRAVDQEPDVRQPGAMMGRPLSASRRGPGCAAPPPSLAITDAHQRRHSS